MEPLVEKALRLCAEMNTLNPGARALAAGGAVRDFLMDRPVHDVDIAHNIPLEDVKKHFNSNGVGRGEEFGVTVVDFEDERFEVTCFRSDGAYSDGKRPDAVAIVNDFKEDSARRDFTINSMGMNVDGSIDDFWGGQKDLRKKVVRCVGCPLDRFAQDPVRMLRAARFAATLEFSIDEETEAGMKAFAIRVCDVAPERVTQEILKASTSGRSLASFIEHTDKAGLLPLFLPEVSALKGLPHNPIHHPEGGVFEHTLAALRVSDSQEPSHNLALLLHDIGKAKTLGEGPNGTPTYHGHEAVGAKMIPAIASRMHWDGALTAVCVDVARDHMKGHGLPMMRKSTRIDLRMSENWDAIKTTVKADSRCRLHAHDEESMMGTLNKLDAEVVSFGSQKEMDAKLNLMASGRTIMETVPGISGKDIGVVKGQTWDWLKGRGLVATPEEVRKFIQDTSKTQA